MAEMSTEIILRGIQGWHTVCVDYAFLAKLLSISNSLSRAMITDEI